MGQPRIQLRQRRNNRLAANRRSRDEIELAAAKIQHDIVLRARIRMVPRNHTHDTLAAATGIDASVLGKLLRGDRTLHLTRIAALERTLGPLRPGTA